MKKLMFHIVKNWPTYLLIIMVTYIAVTNFHIGKLIIGNDNFSPELNPALTFNRSFLNPSWRTYRMLGVPSDSEQADWWRAGIYSLLNLILPTWVISQFYIFITLIIGVISIKNLSQYFLLKKSRSAQFLAGLFYLTSLVTLWIYSYPVHLFVAAYSFTPLVLWRILQTIKNPTKINKFILFLSSIALGTAALTATIFLVISCLIVTFVMIYTVIEKRKFKASLIGLIIFLLPHLFWIPSFALYVKSNQIALQDSYINREITSTTVQSETTQNTPDNVIKFTGSWLETKENNNNYTYEYHDWYKLSRWGIYLGYLLPLLALLGLLFALLHPKKSFQIILLSILPILGILLIKGVNPPFNYLYIFLDGHIPLFHQVFRWGSSKFWPFIAIPLPLIGAYFISQLSKFLKIITIPIIVLSLCIYSYPIWTGNLIRDDVFVNVPDNYQKLTNVLSSEPTERIHTSPDTNTRYFRKYDWGFWGSVFLNYQIPNPTTEKALIIGSRENESAFSVIDSIYHSGQPQAYLNSLNMFDIRTILSDSSVTNAGLSDSYSFPYNWNLHNRLTADNPSLNQLWEDQFLALYHIPNNMINTIAIPFYSHNSTNLNSILALQETPRNYYLASSGTIYPLALDYYQIATGHNNVILTSKYDGSDITYNTNYPETSKILIKHEDNSVLLSSYLPTLLKNNEVVYSPTESIIELGKNTPLISVQGKTLFKGDQMIADNASLQAQIWDKPITSTSKLGRIRLTDCRGDNKGPGNISENRDSISVNITGKACLSADSNIESSGYVQPQFKISSTHPTTVKVCVDSALKHKCLNREEEFDTSNSPSLIEPHLLETVDKGDNLALFFTFTPKESNSSITINDFTLTTYSTGTILNLEKTFLKTPDAQISFHKGDLISLSIPLDSHSVNFPLTRLLPFYATCEDRVDHGNTFRVDPFGGTRITTNRCFDGFYQPLGKIDQADYPFILTVGSATNISGIPLELNIRQGEIIRKQFTDLFRSSIRSNITSLVPTTEGNNEYTIEVVNIGIGNNDSVNTIHSLMAIPIPRDWLKLKLNSNLENDKAINTLSPLYKNTDVGVYFGPAKSGLSTISQAASPYWIAYLTDKKPNFITSYLGLFTHQRLSQKTLINSWKQAWLLENPSEGNWVVVVFLPNLISYLGFIFGFSIAIFLIAKKSKLT